MVAKNSKVFDPHNPAEILSIFLLDLCEDRNFHESLLDQLRRLLDDLESLILLQFMIVHFQHFAERSSVDCLLDLKPICDMATNLVPEKLP